METLSIDKWFCVACSSLLGVVENKKIIRIKRKDLYLEIEGGKITVICCRCGKPNTLVDDKIKIERG